MTTDPDETDRGSVTHWIADLKDGETSAAQRELWDRYFRRLVLLARMKLGDAPRGAEDEEDVALSALNSVFHGAQQQRFPQLNDRGNLWSLLAKITARKAINQRERLMAQKRGGGKVGSPPMDQSGRYLEQIDDELSPEFLVAMREECERLMELLPDETLRLIARRKLEGYTSAEIATELDVVERTIERKLGLIRAAWGDSSAAGR